MWSKLVFLAPFALTTTAADKTTGEILADPNWGQLGLACLRETCAVAVAEGAKVDADTVIAGVMKMPGNMRSSMQKGRCAAQDSRARCYRRTDPTRGSAAWDRGSGDEEAGGGSGAEGGLGESAGLDRSPRLRKTALKAEETSIVKSHN
jgi:hypothetical protein